MKTVLNFLAVILMAAGCAFTGVAADKPNGQTLDVNGVKLWYFVEGQGEPVVLIHGWLSSAGMNWVVPGTAGLLEKHYQVIALDMRGHGQSDKPLKEDAYGPELVADIERLMDHLKIKKAHIVDYSMGGIVAADFIAKHPDRVLTGMLGGMGWMQSGGAAQWMFAQIKRNDPNASAAQMCGRSLAKLALTEDELKSIKVPMMVLVGGDDRLINRMYVDPLRRVRPDWPVVEVSGANHISCIMKPQFKDEIEKWLLKNSGGVK